MAAWMHTWKGPDCRFSRFLKIQWGMWCSSVDNWKDYTIGTLHYNWISHAHVCACVTGLQHVQCADSVIMPRRWLRDACSLILTVQIRRICRGGKKHPKHIENRWKTSKDIEKDQKPPKYVEIHQKTAFDAFERLLSTIIDVFRCWKSSKVFVQIRSATELWHNT